jgi:hypothetical protein
VSTNVSYLGFIKKEVYPGRELCVKAALAGRSRRYGAHRAPVFLFFSTNL